MHNTGEILQLCRLCLVKEQVNVPIFEGQGDVKQIFQKISSCLPVKINRSDKLPKNICDGCSEKLDLFYDFWNTSVNSEKQLLEWLGQTPLSAGAGTTIAAKNSKSTDPVQQIKVDVKQEPSDHTDNNESFQADASAVADEDETSFKSESGPPPKRARRAATKRKPITVAPDTDDDDDDDYEPVEPLTKLEDESGNSDNDNEDDSFANAPSTSADDQPGPSGIGKDGVEAPLETVDESGSGDDSKYQCGVCNEIFPSKNKFLEHHMNLFGEQYICCKCKMSFKTCTSLYNHYETHKVGLTDEGSEIVEEIVLDYDEESNQVVVQPAGDNNELLYILDDEDDESQVNEIVVEDPQMEDKAKADAVAIVNLEHGYMIPQKKRLQHALYGAGNQIVIRKRVSLPEKASKRMYTPPKVRTPQLKRRHEVPDFSATAYVYIQPSEEIEVGHYKCLRCEQLFINKFGFYRHIEKGKCYINNCDVCPATFTKNRDFYEHYVASHTDRAVCNFCFRTFMYEKNVKEHMLRHLDQFRHKCEDCNKGFYTVREYRNHYKNRHMGIRHKCNVCGRSFADEYYFKRHVATHSNATIVQISSPL